jgi:hypothetical protein
LTVQTPDVVIYENHKYEVAGLKGKGLLTPTDLGISPSMMATNCYRGYICQYEIIDQKLYLTGMKVRTADNQYPVVDEVSATLLFKIIGKYQNLKIFCEFSGGLVLVRDALSRSRVVVPIPSSFRTVIELILENGKMEQLIDHSEKMPDIRRQVDEVPDSSNKRNLISKIEWSFVSGYKQQPPMW